ncbi:MAG: FkbM family methyltransferase [Thermoleophilaceae bacterium]|nr:FkbM family methyltransferase [Thermoleophilaceae bacterium]
MASPAAIGGRALRASPALRAVADTPIAQRLIQTERAVRLLRPARSVVAGRRGSVGRYRLRNGGAQLHLRRRSRDLDILAEIFAARSYEPPAEVLPLLDGPLRIADLGGNVGLFGAWALGRWDVVRIRSYEPDPANAELLSATAAPFPCWEVAGVAVGAASGTLRFAAGMLSESRAALHGEDWVGVPVVDLFAEPAADLLKVDIEGAEWPILADPRLAGLDARVIVMEWHALGCPDPDPADAASRLLARAGYGGQDRVPGRFPSCGTIWAWRAHTP